MTKMIEIAEELSGAILTIDLAALQFNYRVLTLQARAQSSATETGAAIKGEVSEQSIGYRCG